MSDIITQNLKNQLLLTKTKSTKLQLHYERLEAENPKKWHYTDFPYRPGMAICGALFDGNSCEEEKTTCKSCLRILKLNETRREKDALQSNLEDAEEENGYLRGELRDAEEKIYELEEENNVEIH